MTITLGSLFSGIGGFDLAAERVGIRVAWQAEIEPFANKVLQKRFPGVPNLGDVTRIENPPHVDVVTFGSPCQDLSVAGQRAGFAGERSGLYTEAIRIIRACRPAFALWENVPGALSSTGGDDFGLALDLLADAGALDIAWGVLDAQWFGLAQRRRRVFVVADFRAERAASILAVPYGRQGGSPPRRETGSPVAASPRSRSHSPGVNAPGRGGEDDQNLIVARALTSHPDRQDGTVETYVCTSGDVANALTSNYGKQPDSSDRNGGPPNLIVASPLTASNGHHEHSSPRGDGADNLVLNVHENQQASISLADVASSLGGGGGKPGQGYAAALTSMGVRRLAPVEAERLQGFPDSWTCLYDQPQPCDCSDGPRYRTLGNAVAVPVVTWILNRLSEVSAYALTPRPSRDSKEPRACASDTRLLGPEEESLS